ncbi:DUF6894 family protein [Mesorhizobium sp. BAC0120]|uniref:DUF6894 family protein n=1 Tax=Mesorhizobium sp. BAC0120 TaxID=3090670 RepID=UPI0039995C22
MARYFFDFQQGETLDRDQDGLEFDGLAVAEREASIAVGRMLSDEAARSGSAQIVVLIRSEQGDLVARVTALLRRERL